MESKLLEITQTQARQLYEEGKVVYIVTDNNTPDTAFNAFAMRHDTKDASLNYYIGDRHPKDVPLVEYIKFIQQCQAEPIHFYTLNSTELYQLPIID